MVEKKYTLGFIRQGDKILLLNKEKGWWMGSWNGVGGKIEPGETPEQGMIREIKEETGLDIPVVHNLGTVTWEAEGEIGGMYIFLADLPQGQSLVTPARYNHEGVLDWKSIPWILHPANKGIPDNIPYFLPSMLEGKVRHYHCVYNDRIEMVDFQYDVLL